MIFWRKWWGNRRRRRYHYERVHSTRARILAPRWVSSRLLAHSKLDKLLSLVPFCSARREISWPPAKGLWHWARNRNSIYARWCGIGCKIESISLLTRVGGSLGRKIRNRPSNEPAWFRLGWADSACFGVGISWFDKSIYHQSYFNINSDSFWLYVGNGWVAIETLSRPTPLPLQCLQQHRLTSSTPSLWPPALVSKV